MHGAEWDSGRGPSRTWQNSADLAEFGRIWQNVAEYGGKRQIAVDCRRLRQSRGRSLVIESVEIGGRAQGVIEVSYNSTPILNSSFCEIGL